jgi:hypothetical protein
MMLKDYIKKGFFSLIQTEEEIVMIAFIEAGKNEMFNILGKLIALEL